MLNRLRETTADRAVLRQAEPRGDGGIDARSSRHPTPVADNGQRGDTLAAPRPPREVRSLAICQNGM